MTNEACFDSKLSIFAIYTFFILLLTYFTIFPTAHILSTALFYLPGKEGYSQKYNPF